ncbi:MAG TPA: hypothetical protein VMV22_04855 [Acidimicrobiales bacterium]|nr:hypothetical protein [Acidimicrobiales bacterium]
MLVFWITVPLMVVAVAMATVPIVVWSISEERRIKCGAYATGRLPVPADDAVRVAATVRPGVTQGELDRAFSSVNAGERAGLLAGAHVHRPAGERAVLVTVPKAADARAGLGRDIHDYLASLQVFERVETISTGGAA